MKIHFIYLLAVVSCALTTKQKAKLTSIEKNFKKYFAYAFEANTSGCAVTEDEPNGKCGEILFCCASVMVTYEPMKIKETLES